MQISSQIDSPAIGAMVGQGRGFDPVGSVCVCVHRLATVATSRSSPSGDVATVARRWMVLATTAFAAGFTNGMAAGALKLGADLNQQTTAHRTSLSASFFSFLVFVGFCHLTLDRWMARIMSG